MTSLRAGFLAAALAIAVAVPLAAVGARAEDHVAFEKQATAQPAAAGHSADPAPAHSPASASNANCPGNPDALGTSRVLPIDFGEYQQVGRMQYPDSVPLNDKDVVITFDDGPLPPYTTAVLDILAAQCVKATFFMVGEMARAFPATVRQVYEQGHTIGTHSDHHPIGIGNLPIERMQAEIDGGIADVSAAFGGDSRYLAPFFRIPGLDRSDLLERELAKRGLIIFSADVVADDWHRDITPSKIIALAMSRLDKRGKGILLLHDIHPKTVAALPGLLDRLKAEGYRIVQVVPSAAYEMAMARRPHPAMLASAVPGDIGIDNGVNAPPVWPVAANDSTPDDIVLPVPDAAAFEPDAGLSDDGSEVTWPIPPPPTVAPKTVARRGKHRTMAARGAQHERPKTARLTQGKVRLAHPSEPERVGRHRHSEHVRGHAGTAADGHRAGLTSRSRAVAALFSPAQTAR